MQTTKIVWISDDDPDDREMLCESLANCPQNLRIDCFESGAKMLEKLNLLQPSSFPNMIILDYHMPGPSGLEVLEVLRENEATSHIPVIFISGRVSETERRNITSRGANFVVSKPSSFSELQSISESICKLWLHASN